MIKNLKISNIRSYEHLDIAFNQGVTVISGINGSGKSSLLEACFTGLFGSKTLTKEFTIADFVRKNATKASIKLDFEQNTHEYSMEQVFRNDPETGKAANTKSVLSIDGEIFTDQAKRTYESMLSLLKMDEEAFRNCVYIRQGEIDLLINARPTDRQKMIDNLLQIGKLEDYRERAAYARTGIGRHQRDTIRHIKEVKKKIEDISATNPTDELNRLLTASKQLANENKNVINLRDKTKSSIDGIKIKIDEYEKLMDFKKTAFNQIQEINSKVYISNENIKSNNDSIQTLKAEIEKLNTNISKIKSGFEPDANLRNILEEYEKIEKDAHDKLTNVQKKIALHIKDNENAQNTLNQFEKQIEEINTSINKIKLQQKDETKRIDAITVKIEDVNKEKVNLENKIESFSFNKKTLENVEETIELVQIKLKMLHGNIMQLSTSKSEIEKHLKLTQDLLNRGRCPTCGQDLCGSVVETSLSTENERIDNIVKNLTEFENKQKETNLQLIQLKEIREMSKMINDMNRQINTHSQEIDLTHRTIVQYETRINENENKLDKLIIDKKSIDNMLQENVEKTKLLKESESIETKKHIDVTGKLQLIKTALQTTIDIDGKNKDIEKMTERITAEQEKIILLQQQKKDYKCRLDEFEKKIGDIDSFHLKERLDQYHEALNNMEIKIKELDESKAEIMKKVGMKQNEIIRLASFEDDLLKLSNKYDYLTEIYKNAEELEEMYIRIRAELRSQNVQTLNTLINQIFSFMYSNNAYSHVKLDHNYYLTIFGKDGTALEPKLLSGGERALFNLVLRCAIYRLLSFSISGSYTNSALPPLILDEPTVFLDKGHVQQLIKLIDSMREFGVGQIIIVSHDETLIDSADHLFFVEKDPTTNKSSIVAK